MRIFGCSCGNTLYFDNTQCLSCGSELGFCPVCYMLVPLRGDATTGYHCGNAACGAILKKCLNYTVENVCNRCIQIPTFGNLGELHCTCCRYNVVIPDLSKPGNREKWRRIESAKRRMFYHLDLLGLPYGKASDGVTPSLAFEFKESLVHATLPIVQNSGRILDEGERVLTGYLNGTITINICEADNDERERLRMQLGEPHRSLIGHFRHEIAHYFWDKLINGQREASFKAVFGDHNNPAYGDALKRYYEQGPPFDWRANYSSAYASMHPWEDFAETFTAYLEMVAAFDATQSMGLGDTWMPKVFTQDFAKRDFSEIIAAYARLGTMMNELNRTMGFRDMLARSLSNAVEHKLHYVHQLVLEVGAQSLRFRKYTA